MSERFWYITGWVCVAVGVTPLAGNLLGVHTALDPVLFLAGLVGAAVSMVCGKLARRRERAAAADAGGGQEGYRRKPRL